MVVLLWVLNPEALLSLPETSEEAPNNCHGIEPSLWKGFCSVVFRFQPLSLENFDQKRNLIKL